jgi:hypothetical protein
MIVREVIRRVENRGNDRQQGLASPHMGGNEVQMESVSIKPCDLSDVYFSEESHPERRMLFMCYRHCPAALTHNCQSNAVT